MDTKNELSRITELERLVAHQDKQIEELSDMTSAQWREIDALKTQVAYLARRIHDDANGADDKSAEAKSVTEFAAMNKPPHY